MKNCLRFFCYFLLITTIFISRSTINSSQPYSGPGAWAKEKYLNNLKLIELLLRNLEDYSDQINKKIVNLPEELDQLAENINNLNNKNLPASERIDLNKLYGDMLKQLIIKLEQPWITFLPKTAMPWIKKLADVLKKHAGGQAPSSAVYITNPEIYFSSNAQHRKRPLYLREGVSLGSEWVTKIEDIAKTEEISQVKKYQEEIEKKLEKIEEGKVTLQEQLFISYGCMLLKKFNLDEAQKEDKLVHFLCVANEENKLIRNALIQLAERGEKLVTPYAKKLLQFHLEQTHAYENENLKAVTKEFLDTYAQATFSMVLPDINLRASIKNTDSCEYKLITSIPHAILNNNSYGEKTSDDVVRLTGQIEPTKCPILHPPINTEPVPKKESIVIQACTSIADIFNILNSNDWEKFSYATLMEKIDLLQQNFQTFVSEATCNYVMQISNASKMFQNDVIKVSLLFNTDLSGKAIQHLASPELFALLKDFRTRKSSFKRSINVMNKNNPSNEVPQKPDNASPHRKLFLEAFEKKQLEASKAKEQNNPTVQISPQQTNEVITTPVSTPPNTNSSTTTTSTQLESINANVTKEDNSAVQISSQQTNKVITTPVSTPPNTNSSTTTTPTQLESINAKATKEDNPTVQILSQQTNKVIIAPVTPPNLPNSDGTKPLLWWWRVIKNTSTAAGIAGCTILISCLAINVLLKQKLAQQLIVTPPIKVAAPLLPNNFNIGTNQTQFLVKTLVAP